VGARTKARKRALDVLFEADQRGYNATSTLDARILLSGRETPLPPYAVEIVRGVVSRWVEINAIIQDASPAWTIARMPGVDRAILRIATWEILCNDDVPTSVAIDEAVTLATGISTDNSPGFVNGLLSTIAKDAPALSRASVAHGVDDEDVESADGAAIFDSLVNETVAATATVTAGDEDDDAEEAEADADFPDSGISNDVAKAWAAGLLADDDATLVPITQAELEASSVPATEGSLEDAGEVTAEADAKAQADGQAQAALEGTPVTEVDSEPHAEATEQLVPDAGEPTVPETAVEAEALAAADTATEAGEIAVADSVPEAEEPAGPEAAADAEGAPLTDTQLLFDFEPNAVTSDAPAPEATPKSAPEPTPEQD